MLNRLKSIGSRALTRHAGKSTKEIKVNAVENYYDRTTASYIAGFGDVFQGSRPQSTEELLNYILCSSGISDGMRILDAGSGVCGPAIWFAQNRSVSIEALTISQVQVDESIRRISQSGTQNQIKVTKGDFHSLGEIYEHRSFDLVMFMESLCHAENYKTVLLECKKVLKPWGKVYIKDFYNIDHRARPHLRANQEEDLKSCKELYSSVFPSLPSLVELFCELGFLIVFLRSPGYESSLEPFNEFERKSGLMWSKHLKSQESWMIFQPIEILLTLPME